MTTKRFGLKKQMGWLVCLFIFSLALPAHPAGRSPEDCKIENCEEWDESVGDCVPIPKTCWAMETIPPKQADDDSCPDCTSLMSPTYSCGARRTFRSYTKKVPSCQGRSSYNTVWAYDQVDYFCKGELDEDAMIRFLIDDFSRGINDPCVQAAINAFYARATGLSDGSQIASLIDDLLACGGDVIDQLDSLTAALMDPWTAIQALAYSHAAFMNRNGWICDFIVCVNDPLKLPRRYKVRANRLTGVDCP